MYYSDLFINFRQIERFNVCNNSGSPCDTHMFMYVTKKLIRAQRYDQIKRHRHGSRNDEQLPAFFTKTLINSYDFGSSSVWLLEASQLTIPWLTIMNVYLVVGLRHHRIFIII